MLPSSVKQGRLSTLSRFPEAHIAAAHVSQLKSVVHNFFLHVMQRFKRTFETSVVRERCGGLAGIPKEGGGVPNFHVCSGVYFHVV
jgi:hypothetical protein